MGKGLLKVKGTAPGQYLGYALQPVRMCFHLLDADKTASVSLEYIEDVAIHLDNGGLILGCILIKDGQIGRKMIQAPERSLRWPDMT